MRQFVGIDLGREPAPDETTVGKFRHLLKEHGLGGEILQTVNLYLIQPRCGSPRGPSSTRPSFMHPSSTKNRAQERDTAMHRTRKG